MWLYPFQMCMVIYAPLAEIRLATQLHFHTCICDSVDQRHGSLRFSCKPSYQAMCTIKKTCTSTAACAMLIAV